MDKSALIVRLPNRLVTNRPYDTGHEVSIESREFSIDLSENEKFAVRQAAEYLHAALPALHLFPVEDSRYIEEKSQPPQDRCGNGVRQVLPLHFFAKPSAHEKPEKQAALLAWPDDPHFTKLLYFSETRFNGIERRSLRVLKSQDLVKEFDVRYALILEIAEIRADINMDEIDLGMTIYLRLISLNDGLLIFEDRFDVSGEDIPNWLGAEIESVRSPAEMLAQDGLIIRGAMTHIAKPLAARTAEIIGLPQKASLARPYSDRPTD